MIKTNKIITTIICTTALFSIGATTNAFSAHAAQVNKFDKGYAQLQNGLNKISKQVGTDIKQSQHDFSNSKLGKETNSNLKEFKQSKLNKKIKRNEKKAIKNAKTVDKKFKKTDTGKTINKYANKATKFLKSEKQKYNS